MKARACEACGCQPFLLQAYYLSEAGYPGHKRQCEGTQSCARDVPSRALDVRLQDSVRGLELVIRRSCECQSLTPIRGFGSKGSTAICSRIPLHHVQAAIWLRCVAVWTQAPQCVLSVHWKWPEEGKCTDY